MLSGRPPTDAELTGVGWKILRLRDQKLYGECMVNDHEYPVGRWLHESEFRPKGWRTGRPDAGQYCGWYIFPSLEDAKEWLASSPSHVNPVLVKVFWRGAVEVVQEHMRESNPVRHAPVIRATEIYIDEVQFE